jgi:hypothetical protein
LDFQIHGVYQEDIFLTSGELVETLKSEFEFGELRENEVMKSKVWVETQHMP